LHDREKKRPIFSTLEGGERFSIPEIAEKNGRTPARKEKRILHPLLEEEKGWLYSHWGGKKNGATDKTCCIGCRVKEEGKKEGGRKRIDLMGKEGVRYNVFGRRR